jgi:integrase
MSGRKRGNREGSIYPYKDGWAAYVWVTTPSGELKRKYVTAKDRGDCHEKWIKLQATALTKVVSTSTGTVSDYGKYWLEEIVKPNLSLGTYINYSGWFRTQIEPGLGNKKYTTLRVRDVQIWLNRVAATCQCCYQGKDTNRPADKQRCCAIGKCCNNLYSKESLRGLRRTLRAMLGCAVAEEEIDKNVAAPVKVKPVRKHKTQRRRWSSEEARRFLESAREDDDPAYVAYVGDLELGLRAGEALGVGEEELDLDAAQLNLAWQLQRLGKELALNELKTDEAEDYLPLPNIYVAAARLRLRQKERDRLAAGEAWQGSDLLLTTRIGTPLEPRSFARMWDRRCDLAGVPRITRRDARRTCSSLLADLDVHPRVAMRILRHSKFDITMEVYTKVSDEATREALRRLGEELG